MKRAAMLIFVISIVALSYLIGAPLVARALFYYGFPLAAANFLSDPVWKGATLYAAGKWNEAAESFAHDGSSNYNLGNALVRAGRYSEAIEAYERALTIDPDDVDARYNKALIEAALQKDSTAVSGRPESSISPSPAIKAGGSRDRPPTDGGPGGAGEGLASGNQTKGQSSAGGKVSKDGVHAATPGEQNSGISDGAAGAFGGAGRTGEVQPNFPDLLQERESRMRRRQQEANVHPSLDWLQTLPDDPGLFLKAKIIAEKARRLKDAGGPIPEDD